MLYIPPMLGQFFSKAQTYLPGRIYPENLYLIQCILMMLCTFENMVKNGQFSVRYHLNSVWGLHGYTCPLFEPLKASRLVLPISFIFSACRFLVTGHSNPHDYGRSSICSHILEFFDRYLFLVRVFGLFGLRGDVLHGRFHGIVSVKTSTGLSAVVIHL